MTPFDGGDSVERVTAEKPRAQRAGLDPSRPHAELESLRSGLAIDARHAAWTLLTLNRQIQPTLDEEARKGMRVIDAVLRMFESGPRLTAGQGKLLERLFATLGGGDLDIDSRTSLAIDEARVAIGAYSRASSTKTKHNVARHFAIALTLRTDRGWESLIDQEPAVCSVLELCLATAGRKRLGEQGLLARLSRGLHVLELPPKAAEKSAADTIRKRLSRTK